MDALDYVEAVIDALKGRVATALERTPGRWAIGAMATAFGSGDAEHASSLAGAVVKSEAMGLYSTLLAAVEDVEPQLCMALEELLEEMMGTAAIARLAVMSEDDATDAVCSIEHTLEAVVTNAITNLRHEVNATAREAREYQGGILANIGPSEVTNGVITA